MSIYDHWYSHPVEKRFLQFDRGVLPAEELGMLVVVELAGHRLFEQIEHYVRRLSPAAAAAAARYAEKVSAPGWTAILTGGGNWAPSEEDLARELEALKRVAGRVLALLSNTSPDRGRTEQGASDDSGS